MISPAIMELIILIPPSGLNLTREGILLKIPLTAKMANPSNAEMVADFDITLANMAIALTTIPIPMDKKNVYSHPSKNTSPKK